MAAIFGPGGPIILPWTVRGDRFSGGTVHGVTPPCCPEIKIRKEDHGKIFVGVNLHHYH